MFYELYYKVCTGKFVSKTPLYHEISGGGDRGLKGTFLQWRAMKYDSPNTGGIYNLINNWLTRPSPDPSIFLHGLSMSTAEQMVEKQTNWQWQTSQ